MWSQLKSTKKHQQGSEAPNGVLLGVLSTHGWPVGGSLWAQILRFPSAVLKQSPGGCGDTWGSEVAIVLPQAGPYDEGHSCTWWPN